MLLKIALFPRKSQSFLSLLFSSLTCSASSDLKLIIIDLALLVQQLDKALKVAANAPAMVLANMIIEKHRLIQSRCPFSPHRPPYRWSFHRSIVGEFSELRLIRSLSLFRPGINVLKEGQKARALLQSKMPESALAGKDHSLAFLLSISNAVGSFLIRISPRALYLQRSTGTTSTPPNKRLAWPHCAKRSRIIIFKFQTVRNLLIFVRAPKLAI